MTLRPRRGGALKHRARPARDAVFVASPRRSKDLAAWWRKVVGRLFIGIAAEDARSLVIKRQPTRTDLAAAYREWLRVVSESIQGIWVGDYKDAPRLERVMRRDDGWTGKYWLLIPKGHQAATDDAARREVLVDLAEELPDWRMTSREVRKIRRRKRQSD